jgi:hypothetical protein
MVVDGHQVAMELKRRRVGRPALVASCDACTTRRTWLPDEPVRVPSSLLVLAAISLTRVGPAA